MILGLLGSASATSGTRRALEELGRRVRSAGRDFEYVDLAVEYRELHDVSAYIEPPAPGSQAEAIRRRVSGSDAIILATPVHHGSFSGLLKNALDQLDDAGFAGRPVGLLAHGSTATGTVGAADALRPVVRALGGWASPTSVGVATADLTSGPGGGLSPAVAERMEKLVGDLLWFPTRARVVAAR
ncbi:NADPH-dependent FMN reductase [Amycolatopsis sp. lyj-23]|uniref:NADPH-dependent FMN reductase n=1 Tax=Amycolatopsis sp. lyj-23 TaxID=2789283 RepID=UPI00397DBEA2